MFTCAHCSREFDRRGKRTPRYCSYPCRNAGYVRYGADQVREYAKRGMRMVEIAARLGTSHTQALKAIRRAGLYREWRAARYVRAA